MLRLTGATGPRGRGRECCPARRRAWFANLTRGPSGLPDYELCRGCDDAPTSERSDVEA